MNSPKNCLRARRTRSGVSSWRRGGILLELLLAIALFATAASFTLSAMRNALDSIRRAELRARAFDLAASRLAELDAGLVSVGDLGNDKSSADTGDLSVEIEVVPTPTSSLARARATVRDRSGGRGVEPTIVAVHERSIELRERGAQGSRP
jgi:type II secretory pathway component PulJ